MSPFTFWKNLFSFYELPVLPDSQRPCKSRTFFGSRLSSRGLGLDYLDCYGDPQELSFGDEGLDLLYKARRIEGSGEAEREVLQSYFFCRRIRADTVVLAESLEVVLCRLKTSLKGKASFAQVNADRTGVRAHKLGKSRRTDAVLVNDVRQPLWLARFLALRAVIAFSRTSSLKRYSSSLI